MPTSKTSGGYDNCMVKNPFLLAGASALSLLAALPSQKDLRDVITLSNGRVIKGRVVTQHTPDEVLILAGGKRTRVEITQIASRELVADKVREFFQRRHRHRGSKRALRYLVDWAKSQQLDNLASLQAMELVLQDDDDAAMHKFLGHSQRGGVWRWPNGSKTQTLEQLHESIRKRPLRIEGERFAIRFDTSLLLNVHALLDLEQLGVSWFEMFGQDLRLKEVLKPIEIQTYRNPTEFPKWGFRPRPYFEPPPHADLGRTYYTGANPTRPDDLFFLGTQGLLYRTMIGQVNQQSSRDRACAWVEVGLGMHMQQIMKGPAGFALPSQPGKMDMHAIGALGRNYRLTHLTHLPMYGGFYLTSDRTTATNWSAALMFATWLLDDDKKSKPTRDDFLSYTRAVLADHQGDSSTTFDRVMGQPIEQFDEPWRAWLHEVAHN
jgi:hypothetical protein